MKQTKFIVTVLICLILVGCSEVELEYPPVKMYEPELTKEDYTFSIFDGTLEEPVPAGEIMYTSGELAKDRYESIEGELGIKVVRILRGDAAKYRISDREMRDLPKEDEEWVMVELEVYNFGNEEETLVFGEDELNLYTTGKAKKIKHWDIGLDTDPTRVVVYEGKPETVILLSKVKTTTTNFLVGFSKLVREYEIVEIVDYEEPTEQEIGEPNEPNETNEPIETGEDDEVSNEESTEEEQVADKDNEEDDDRSVLDRMTKYLETKDTAVYTDFFQED